MTVSQVLSDDARLEAARLAYALLRVEEPMASLHGDYTPPGHLLGLSGVALAGAWSLASDHPEKGQIVVAGVSVSPALGHWYADNYRRAIGGALGRTGLTAAGFAMYFDQCQILGPCNREAANATLALAGVAVLAWAALDLVQAPESARRYNARRASQGSPDVVPTPRERDLEAGPLSGCVTLCRGRQ